MDNFILPSKKEAKALRLASKGTPISAFIFHNEPEDKEASLVFREQLVAALQQAYIIGVHSDKLRD